MFGQILQPLLERGFGRRRRWSGWRYRSGRSGRRAAAAGRAAGAQRQRGKEKNGDGFSVHAVYLSSLAREFKSGQSERPVCEPEKNVEYIGLSTCERNARIGAGPFISAQLRCGSRLFARPEGATPRLFRDVVFGKRPDRVLCADRVRNIPRGMLAGELLPFLQELERRTQPPASRRTFTAFARSSDSTLPDFLRRAGKYWPTPAAPTCPCGAEQCRSTLRACCHIGITRCEGRTSKTAIALSLAFRDQ